MLVDMKIGRKKIKEEFCTRVQIFLSFYEMQGLLIEMEIDPRSTIHYKLPSKTLEDGLVLLGEGD